MTSCVMLVAVLLAAPPPGKHAMGLIPPTDAQYKRMTTSGLDFKSFVKGIKALPPPKVDLSDRMAKPDEHGQGGVGSCVSWAMGYDLKSYQEAVEHGWKPEGDNRRFSPSYIYNQRPKRPSSGMDFADALAILARSGCVTWDKLPYEESESGAAPGPELIAQGVPYQVADFMVIDPCTVGNLQLMLANNLPIIVGMNCDSAFHRLRGDVVLDQYDREEVHRLHEGGEGTGHAICIVGYDDTRDAFRIQNSWGTDWGDRGCAWIKQKLFERNPDQPRAEQFCSIAFVVFDAPTVQTRTRVQASGDQNGQKAYTWEVAFDAPSETLGEIRSVLYRLRDPFQPPQVERKDPRTAFMLASTDVQPSTSTEPVTIEVELTMRDGTPFARTVVVPCGATAGVGRATPRGETVVLPDLRGAAGRGSPEADAAGPEAAPPAPRRRRGPGRRGPRPDRPAIPRAPPGRRQGLDRDPVYHGAP